MKVLVVLIVLVAVLVRASPTTTTAAVTGLHCDVTLEASSNAGSDLVAALAACHSSVVWKICFGPGTYTGFSSESTVIIAAGGPTNLILTTPPSSQGVNPTIDFGGEGSSAGFVIPANTSSFTTITNLNFVNRTALSGNGGCLSIDGTPGVLLANLVFSACHASNGSGGAIALLTSGSWTLTLVDFAHCTSMERGGALWALVPNDVAVEGSVAGASFYACEAGAGGAVSFYLDTCSSSPSASAAYTINDSEFTWNTATNKGGAAVDAFFEEMSEKCPVVTVTVSGGTLMTYNTGAAAFFSSGPTVVMNDVQLAQNFAPPFVFTGPALTVESANVHDNEVTDSYSFIGSFSLSGYSYPNASVALFNSRFSSNDALSVGYFASISVDRCTFFNNTRTSLYLYNSGSDVTVTSSSFAQSNATTKTIVSAGLYLDTVEAATLTNLTFINGGGTALSGALMLLGTGPVTLSQSLVEGSVGWGVVVTDVASQGTTLLNVSSTIIAGNTGGGLYCTAAAVHLDAESLLLCSNEEGGSQNLVCQGGCRGCSDYHAPGGSETCPGQCKAEPSLCIPQSGGLAYPPCEPCSD